MDNLIEKLISVKPSERQLSWQKMEFYAFACIGVNTFTDNEWGNGKESPKIFNPTQLDTEQWVKAYKSAGMTGVILTAKHHDGFCLWPSNFTDHSVKSSPWRDGAGDLVKELSESCKKFGLKLGIYLSPWDMHEKTYGTGEKYDDYFVAQLRELLTGYGEVFCVWFDGACGEGKNGKKQVYDWQRYYNVIRELQPNAVINVSGPDVRWCGNEAGKCRKSEWSVVPKRCADCETIAQNSQQVDDGRFSRKISSEDKDLGSRNIVKDEKEFIWYPAEVDTSIRKGWYYHKSDDKKIRSVKKLLKIYYNSVGANSALLLSIPPDKRGLINEIDVDRLKKTGDYLAKTFADNLAKNCNVTSSCECMKNCEAENVLSENEQSFWQPKNENNEMSLILDFEATKQISHIVIKEHIADGQRIEKFAVFMERFGKWRKIKTYTVVGYKRICKFRSRNVNRIKIQVLSSRSTPQIQSVEVF